MKKASYLYIYVHVCVHLSVYNNIKVKETMKLSEIWVEHDSAI